MSDEIEDIRKQREAVYGEFEHGHTQLGRLWASMLSNHLGVDVPDLPPSLVLVMLAGLKLNRLGTPSGRKHHDNYLDAKAYLQMSEECEL